MSHGWQSKSTDESKSGWRQRSVAVVVVNVLEVVVVMVVVIVVQCGVV